MARIRTLKPEILEDERTAGLSDPAYRLFTSLIILADDYGNLRADERWLIGQIWWARRESPRIAELLRELAGASLVLVYRVRDQSYVHVRGWEKHQRIDNAGKPRVPGPKDPEAEDITVDPSKPRGDSRKSAAKFGEIPLDPDPDPDPDPSGKPDPGAYLAAVAIGEINRMAGTAFVPDAKSALAAGKSLADNKHSEADVLAVIRSKRDWLAKPEMRKHFCPATLLRAGNFQRYLDDLRGRSSETSTGGQLSLVRDNEPETMTVNGVEYVIG